MQNLMPSLFPYDSKTVSRGALACVKFIQGKRRDAKGAAIQRRMDEIRRKWWGGKYQISREEAEREVAALEFYEGGLNAYDWTLYGERDLSAALELICSLVYAKDGDAVYLSREDSNLVNTYTEWEKTIKEDNAK